MTRNPTTDRQTQAPAALCGRCRGEVYRHELLFVLDGTELCPDCFRQRVLRLLEESPAQLALLLGAETREASERKEASPCC